MAHKLMWFQGKLPFVVPACEDRSLETSPASKRTAKEYNRGYFTLTNVLNPNIHYDDLGIETRQKRLLKDVVKDDTLWLALVPPKHHITDVFAYNEETFTEHSSLETFGGITVTLVSADFKAADKDGNSQMGEVKEHGTVAFPASNDAKEQFLRKATDITNGIDTWHGIGIRIDALPTNKSLADIVGKLVVGCHCIDYDAQTFM